MRLSGRAVEDLFDRPFASKTLSEFWSKRWNRPFVAMNRELFMPAFRKVFGTRGAVVCAFLVSGVLHELAISYPSGGGWGGPLVYFALQAALVLLERKLKVRSRLWALTAVLLPLPLLFHGPFRTVLVVPFFHFLRYLLCAHTVGWYFGWGLWVMGGLQLSVLLASFQVPAALNWKEDLAKLTPFNRKLMWVYGSFIVTTITGFGLLTLVLHQSLLKGESAAVALAAFISIFWILRILTDHFYFEDADWPKGERYVVGHALLNSLFTFLILSYGGLAVWHLAGY
jgi:alginate O-acetyltransferase complex protein AlgI